MTRKEVIVRAMDGRFTWIAAAEILGISPRQKRWLKTLYERHGYGGRVHGRGGTPRRKRIPVATIRTLLSAAPRGYPDFSIQHFWEHVTEKHGLELSYTWTRLIRRLPALRPSSRHGAQRPTLPLTAVLRLLLSAQHEPVVRNDSTVVFGALHLQLPPRRERPHYARCPVLVHEFPDDALGISYQGGSWRATTAGASCSRLRRTLRWQRLRRSKWGRRLCDSAP